MVVGTAVTVIVDPGSKIGVVGTALGDEVGQTTVGVGTAWRQAVNKKQMKSHTPQLCIRIPASLATRAGVDER
jgi:hypothetical protein